MRRLGWIVMASWLVGGSAAAQVVAADELRGRMAGLAAELAESVAGGPGGIEQMAGFDRGASMLFGFDDAERHNWQYWPAARVGLSVELMTQQQRVLTHALLNSVLSSQGYLKATQIMQLEQILLLTDAAGFPRSVGHYKLSIFGDPGIENDWAWRFEGHHVSLSVTVGSGGITVTPSFFGSNPAEVTSGPLGGLRVHGGIEDMARDLVMSLSAGEQRAAIVSATAPGEILTTQLRVDPARWAAITAELDAEGIRVGDLNEVQQAWVHGILGEVIDNYRAEIATAYRAEIDLRELRFAWMGSTERGEPHYFRVQGGDFIYEYDNVQNRGNHVHSVWRSKSSDFGAGALAEHYSAVAH